MKPFYMQQYEEVATFNVGLLSIRRGACIILGLMVLVNCEVCKLVQRVTNPVPIYRESDTPV